MGYMDQRLEWRLQIMVQMKEEILKITEELTCENISDMFHSRGLRLKTKNSTSTGTEIMIHSVNIL